MEDILRARIAFHDLVGVVEATISEKEFTLEMVQPGITMHLETCNHYDHVTALEEGGLYFFGMYQGQSIAVRYLSDSRWVSRDCCLLAQAIEASFPGEKITLLPIHVLAKGENEAVFRFCFGNQELRRMFSTSDGIDIQLLSKG